MFSLKTAFPATSELAIAEFERSIGAQLPDDYRRFLLTCNGGEPVDGEFAVNGWGSTVVHVFYGLNTGYKAYNIDWSKSVFDDVLPESIVPIACDPGGYLVCLGVKGVAQGKVYFWDRGEKLDELILLAPSFEDFVDGLKPSGSFR